MEKNKYLEIGKNFYEWYRTNKVSLTVNNSNHELDREIRQTLELIDYVTDKIRKT